MTQFIILSIVFVVVHAVSDNIRKVISMKSLVCFLIVNPSKVLSSVGVCWNPGVTRTSSRFRGILFAEHTAGLIQRLSGRVTLIRLQPATVCGRSTVNVKIGVSKFPCLVLLSSLFWQNN